MIDLRKYQNTDVFLYMLLSRLQADCEYYLGCGNRLAACLWAGNEKDQIKLMFQIWDNFPQDAKPMWLSREKIMQYERSLQPYPIDTRGRTK